MKTINITGSVKVINSDYANSGYSGEIIGMANNELLVLHPSGSDAWEDINNCEDIKFDISINEGKEKNLKYEYYQLVANEFGSDAKNSGKLNIKD